MLAALRNVKLSDNFSVGYVVKVSDRAKSVRLKISVHDGLTVIVPQNFKTERIPVILESKKSWIKTHLERFDDIKQFVAHNSSAVLPEAISLPALGRTWQVEYRQTNAKTVAVRTDENGRLMVYGATDNRAACRKALKRWLTRQTREQIAPWIQQLSRQHRLSCPRVLIKGQRTRWASCSKHKTISLNYKLLFLKRDIVRYVLLHELCHTLQMNHSQKFWTVLASLEPGYKKMNSELRHSWKQVPGWAN